MAGTFGSGLFGGGEFGGGGGIEIGEGLPAGSALATPSIVARGTFGEYGVNVRTVGFEEDGKLRRITEQGGNVGKRRG